MSLPNKIILIGISLLLILNTTVLAQCTPIMFFKGEFNKDSLGSAVANAGDVNNDGVNDILVSATQWPGNSNDDSGKVYVYSGDSGSVIRTHVGPDKGTLYGASLTGLGDLNGDGYDEYVIGEPAGGPLGRGNVYVISGIDGSVLYLFTANTANEQFGKSVANAGDVNNDGFNDLLVGDPGYDTLSERRGRAYLFSGADTTLLWSGIGADNGGFYGFSVAGIGDRNNDNFDDFAVGAYGETPSSHGAVYVYNDTTSLWKRFEGQETDGWFGYSIAGGIDLNGDSIGDIAIGEPRKFEGINGGNT
ncbi:MAG: FG-GAP repeat protein, partial [candidate division Zixibacteria bacterium]|nr:FG-GAP repeat protein [candidate division Zixibacteria bacterium]